MNTAKKTNGFLLLLLLTLTVSGQELQEPTWAQGAVPPTSEQGAIPPTLGQGSLPPTLGQGSVPPPSEPVLVPPVVDLEPITINEGRTQRIRKSGMAGSQIYTGKKNTQVEVKVAGPIVANNYRQIVTEVPGLNISEVNHEGFASITYRGLGDPHESFNLLTLEDGIPISADIYGYPAAYYQPPLDTIDKIEFLRGGAALAFGPQAGGALNYTSSDPGPDSLNGRFRLLGGQYGYGQGFAQLDGRTEKLNYLVSVSRRQANGFRDTNSGSNIEAYNLKLGYQLSSQLSIQLKAQDYNGRHEEAGGLARTAEVPTAIGIDRSYTATTSPFDELTIDRDLLGLTLTFQPSTRQDWEILLWHSNLARSSFRQDHATGQDKFGTVKQGATNDITHQHFNTHGGQVKGSSRTHFFAQPLNVTYGYRYYENSNPLENLTGATVAARSGVTELLVERQSLSHALYTEAELQLGKWSIVPGLRYENIRQSLAEQYRSVSTARPDNSLRSTNLADNVLLYGLGIEKQLGESRWKFIANSSSGFTPVLFAEAFPVNPAETINADLASAKVLNHEIGVAGDFGKTATAEISTFYVTNSNQIGRVGNTFLNVGKAEYQGLEGLIIVDLIREFGASIHSLEATIGYSLLEAALNSADSNTNGKTPQYAPQHTLRWRLSYLHSGGVGVNLGGQWLSRQFADDGNSAHFEMPSYTVWDLGAEVPLWLEELKLQLAIRNLFDVQYFARINANGIEPGMPRMATLGMEYTF